MDLVCGRCGAANAMEWTEELVACQPCGVRYSEIMYADAGPELDDYVGWLGWMFTCDLANAWWRAGS